VTKPRVLVVADVPEWAWGRRARAYRRHLAGRFEIAVVYTRDEPVPDLGGFDLVHTFEVSQLDRLAGLWTGREGCRVVSGLTAHVSRTWGPDRMREWAAGCSALHGNSLLICEELKPFHPLVHYLPNGVDPVRFHPPEVLRSGPVVFAHCGKPNPRKGGALIVGAARRAGVTLMVNQRTSRVALDEDSMAAWVRGVDVMVTASNMDGTPNPMLEAAASGAALLSTPIGNMPELIADGVNGFLLPELPGRAEGRVPLPTEGPAVERLSEAMMDRMQWFADYPTETRMMGAAARGAILAGWTWERQVPNVAALWSEVLGL